VCVYTYVTVSWWVSDATPAEP